MMNSFFSCNIYFGLFGDVCLRRARVAFLSSIAQ
nr:MAG TPA: hypothetical protein [Caudoviricetes sp.]